MMTWAACRDGQSRQLAFVGFRSVEQAAAAQAYFDHTFIDACRISVEVGLQGQGGGGSY